MMLVLILISIAAIAVSVYFTINNAKLKARITKLEVENKNLEYELGNTIIQTEKSDGVISQEKINAIKEKYIATSEIKKVKGATKEDVENFYKSQSETNDDQEK